MDMSKNLRKDSCMSMGVSGAFEAAWPTCNGRHRAGCVPETKGEEILGKVRPNHPRL